ncbi:cold-regulated protein 27 [Punica granatum]|uniref:Uncharacterized protein n=2 Tax=Punica granatum TaxID=22663 RepID=A0A218X719_PUNGR|nr:cold-regulated protein 27 [Punica granatum]OWM80723.1 hypothetical protein CDL15_Pgr006753 [Punica granatum]PKI50634.1 hypothetical protein CRG98_028946 [Punica granatum]
MEKSQSSRSTASSNASAEQKLCRTPESSMAESMSMEWTDEKHSLYLKSIEASFVNQLYNSLDLRNCHSQNEQSSGKMPKPISSPSGQFKVLRDGFWQEINFTRPGFQQHKDDESRYVLSSPWIKHFKSAPKLPECEAVSMKDKGKISCASAANLEQPSQCWSHRKVGGINSSADLEVSDQNFINDDEEGDNAGKSSMDGAKRMKTREGGTPSTDQVVPFGMPPLNDDVTKTCASLGG